MPYTIDPLRKNQAVPSFHELLIPVYRILSHTPPLEAKGDRPLQMEFEHQLKALIFYHLEEYSSGSHLVQALEEDEFAKKEIAPPEGIRKSSFFEAVNHRGLEQLLYIFEKLQADAAHTLPKEYAHLGDLVSIDGSLIDGVLSMHWADYRDGSKKAKAHLGFNVNNSIPQKIFLTDGKGDERPFVSKILSPGQTGIMDRYYQCHKDFDLWQTEGKHFVCRIKKKTNKTVIETQPVSAGSIVFYDATVLLGTPNVNQTIKPVRLVGYRVDGKKYWVATDRYDITAEEVACIYKLRWDIEVFFGWWKRHLKVYHLIARSQYGLMVQILGGLITYLLIAIYCHNNFNEKVSIKRVRELRIKIKNEASNYDFFACGAGTDQSNIKKQKKDFAYAKT
ncbi:MAG: transposase [Candidatus Scalindua brodae]|uniref:Transposase n=1 Tax=Candidatus Scalindua brodae TaxID=237368 RepID=A0A0B0EB17_9BACT|nr:MAG: transposase [Candidatus Scalindua brodae]